MYNFRSLWCWYIGSGSGILSTLAPFGLTLVISPCSIGVGEPYMSSAMLILSTVTLQLRKICFEIMSLKWEVLGQSISCCDFLSSSAPWTSEVLKYSLLSFTVLKKKKRVNVWYKFIGSIIIVKAITTLPKLDNLILIFHNNCTLLPWIHTYVQSWYWSNILNRNDIGHWFWIEMYTICKNLKGAICVKVFDSTFLYTVKVSSEVQSWILPIISLLFNTLEVEQVSRSIHELGIIPSVFWEKPTRICNSTVPDIP